MPVVRISDDVFARLQTHAEPLVDSINDVLVKILNTYEEAQQPRSAGATHQNAKFESFLELWPFVIAEYDRTQPRFPTTAAIRDDSYKPIKVGLRHIHYEFAVRKRAQRFDVCLHFEANDLKTNLAWLERVTTHETALRDGIAEEYEAGPWRPGNQWAQLMFRVPFQGNLPDEAAVMRGIELMNILVERSWPALEPLATN